MEQVTCTVRFLVDAQGCVVDADASACDARVSDPALLTIRKWLFYPHEIDGFAVPFVTEQSFVMAKVG